MFGCTIDIQGCSLDDHKAFDEIVKRHQSDVRNLLLKLLNFNSQEVDDLYQDVFIKIYQRIKTFKGRSAFSTWVYQITYRTFIDQITKRKKYKEYVRDSSSLLNTVEYPNVNNVLDAEKVVMCLSPEEKTAIQLSLYKWIKSYEYRYCLKLQYWSSERPYFKRKEKNT